MKFCAAPGCDRVARSQAKWSKNPHCQFHETRLRDTGDLALQPRPSAWDRFVDRVVVAVNGCWMWTGSGTGRGYVYGQFWHDGKNDAAHRYSYETMIGPIPAGLQIDHLCRVEKCVNPAHLEVVTTQVNLQRRDAAKKGAT